MRDSPRLPPGPRPRVPGSLELAIWRDALGTLGRIAREYGDVASFRFGRATEVLVNDPELIRRVLVTDHRSYMKGRALQETKRVLGDGLLTSEGELHRRQRRLAQPLFHRRRIEAYAGTIVELADRMQRGWRDGEVRDVHAELAGLTLAIVGRTLFDADVEGEAAEIGEALTTSLEAVNRIVYPGGAALDRLPLPASRRFERARARLDATIYRLIDERRAAPGAHGDLLSLLLEARDEEGGAMSERQVRDEAMTIFLAGHETTANLLGWTWYLLARHPAVEEQIQAELDGAVAGGAPTVDELARLELTERVLAEALRLYPPAWITGRRALVEVELGGYELPAGAVVLISPYVTQRDPRWYPEPDRFDPERWRPEARAARPQFAYFPFGGGPRVCIGEAFALQEAKLVLATVARRWSLRLAPGRPVTPQPRVTLRPRHGLRMRLAARG